MVGYALLAILAILGVALVLYFTRFGPGASGDSVSYVMGAQNLLAGNGYSRTSGGGELRPITGFPPFYSFVLACIAAVGTDLFEGARLFNALLFGANIFWVGWLIRRYSQSIWAALLGGALVLMAQHQVLYHGWVMSEALFIFLMLLAFYGLTRYLVSNKLLILLMTGAVVSMATLTRYVGLSLIATGLVVLFFLNKGDLKRRLTDCFVFAAVSLAPLYLWLRRNAVVAGTAVNRDLIYHPMREELFRAFRSEITYWFVPSAWGIRHKWRRALMLLIALPAPLLFFYLEFRDLRNRDRARGEFWALPWIIAVFCVMYAIILVVNSTLLDAATTLSAPSRYLAPVFVAAVLLFVILFHRLCFQRSKWLVSRGFAAGIGILLIVLYALQTMAIVADPYPHIGYMGLRAQRSETLARLRAINQNAPIITNNPELIFILLERSAYARPIRFDPYKLAAREDFEYQMDATRERLERGGWLVLFPPLEEVDLIVIDRLGVELMDSFYGSYFYGYSWILDN